MLNGLPQAALALEPSFRPDGSGFESPLVSTSAPIPPAKANALFIHFSEENVTGKTIGLDLASIDKTLALSAVVSPEGALHEVIWA